MGRGAALSSASASAPRGLRRSSFDVFLRCQHLPVPRAWAAPPPPPPEASSQHQPRLPRAPCSFHVRTELGTAPRELGEGSSAAFQRVYFSSPHHRFVRALRFYFLFSFLYQFRALERTQCSGGRADLVHPSSRRTPRGRENIPSVGRCGPGPQRGRTGARTALASR